MPDYKSSGRHSISDEELRREYLGQPKDSFRQKPTKAPLRGKNSRGNEKKNPNPGKTGRKNSLSPYKSSGEVERRKKNQPEKKGEGREQREPREQKEGTELREKPPVKGQSPGNITDRTQQGRYPPRKSGQARQENRGKAGEKTKQEKGKNGRNDRKEKRRGKKGKKSMVLYYIMFGTLTVLLFSILSVTVLFNISVIEVEGETVYTDEEVIKVSGYALGDNLVRLNTSSGPEKILSQLVYIDGAEIIRQFPDRLVIEVHPAEPMANFKFKNKYYIFSYKGRLLDISGSAADCPVVEGVELEDSISVGDMLTSIGSGNSISAGRIINRVMRAIGSENPVSGIKMLISADEENKNKLEAVSQIITEMNEQGLDKSAYVDISDLMDVKITYDNRIQMELGQATRIHEKIYAAGVLISTEIPENDRTTILLTNPERVVVRPIYAGHQGNSGYIPEETAPEATTPSEESTSETEAPG